MSMTAEDILQLPPEKQPEAIEDSADNLSLDDIQRLSEAMIEKVEQNLQSCDGFIEDQKVIEKSTEQAENTEDPASPRSDDDSHREQVIEHQDTPAETIEDDTQRPTEDAAQPEIVEDVSDDWSSEAPEETEPTPVMLTAEQRVAETPEQDGTAQAEDDPAARHGFPELSDEDMESQKRDLIQSMMSASYEAQPEDVVETEETRKRPIWKAALEGFGTLQFRLMPLFWGVAGGWLAMQEITSRMDLFPAVLVSVLATMVIAQIIGRISRQPAAISMLLAGAVQCVLGIHAMGIPEIPSENLLSADHLVPHAVIVGLGVFYLIAAGATAIFRR
ncbi:hypothetical protein [Salipiger mucosus]|uniref:Uncharacterized protein n=1 Tax=Salipiger mucosus DSM 16094 TaxID=1123237 RepID=S9QRK5_9RHOB|nr:hypothetical protein [Salipiger mucosus]EPX84021.1 hypothetical protein Salmuc_01796 [Salipiger mucosus DSM 16094]